MQEPFAETGQLKVLLSARPKNRSHVRGPKSERAPSVPSLLRATVRRKTCNSANSSPVHPRGPKRARRPLVAAEIVESFSGIPRTRTVSELPSSSLRRFFCLGNRTAGLSCCGYEWSRRQGRSTNGGRKNDASSATFEGGRGGRVRSVNGHLPLVPSSFPVCVLASAARRCMRKGPLTFRSFRIRIRKKWRWLFCWVSPSSSPLLIPGTLRQN